MNTILTRACPTTAIPSGEAIELPAGLEVFVTQTLGGNVTVRTDQGLFRIAKENTDVLRDYVADETKEESEVGEFCEDAVWEALKTCFDPEIPVNIVDLGLIYDLDISTQEEGNHVVEVKMTLTAPGCGMGPVIAEDAREKLAALPTVTEAKVHIVWDPVWAPQMISEEGRKKLGLD